MESGKIPQQNPDAAAQLELKNLERQFRKMKNEKAACPPAVRQTLAKQKQLIADLEKEKSQILMNFECYDRKKSQSEPAQASGMVVQLLLENKNLDKAVAATEERLEELKVQYRLKNDQIVAKRRVQKGAALQAEILDKNDENLENILNNEAIRYNEELLRAAHCGRQLESLLMARARFQKEFNIVKKDLAAGEKIICDLIEQSSYAHDQRRKAESKLFVLKTKAKEELVQNGSEARRLERTIIHVKRINGFLVQKGQRRIYTGDEKIANKKKARDEEMTVFLKKYGKIAEDITQTFAEHNINRLCQLFLKLEGDNYGMCTFNIDHFKKLHEMQAKVRRLQQDITNQRKINQQTKEEQSQIIVTLENDIAIKRKMVIAADEALQTAKKDLDNLLTGILHLFNLVDGDNEEICKKLGKNEEIRTDNVMMYLKGLELRFNELKIVYFRYVNPTGSPLESLNEIEKFTRKIELPETPCPLCSEARHLAEVEDSITGPLTVKEYGAGLKIELEKGQRLDLLHREEKCPFAKSRGIRQK